MSDKTPQEKGYEWDRELGKLVGGEHHKGSGNRQYRKLDASGKEIVVSGKYVDAASFSVKETDLDEMLAATAGPEASIHGAIPILAAKYRSGRTIAVLDLDQLIEWLKEPPELIPATKQDALRATVRKPSYLRET